MHTLHLQIDDSIFDKFMGLLDILPKDKVSISREKNSISYAQAQLKVKNALNNISKNEGLSIDEAFEKVINS